MLGEQVSVLALSHKGLDALLRSSSQQWAILILTDSAQNLLDRCYKRYDLTVTEHTLAITLPQYRASACRKDNAALLQHLVKHQRLKITEMGLPLFREDLRNGAPGLLDDLFIEIDEAVAELAREMSAYCRLPGSHHADEYNIISMIAQEFHLL